MQVEQSIKKIAFTLPVFIKTKILFVDIDYFEICKYEIYY